MIEKFKTLIKNEYFYYKVMLISFLTLNLDQFWLNKNILALEKENSTYFVDSLTAGEA